MYEPNEKKSKIDNIKDILYSQNADGIFAKKRHDLEDRNPGTYAPSVWQADTAKPASVFHIPYAKIALGAFVFFVLALGFTFFKFFIGSNTVSGDNINILVNGPVSVGGGEELPLDIKIVNNNKVDLTNVSLLVEYPDGTREVTDPSTVLSRYSEVLGDIPVGGSEERLLKSLIFGEQNTQEVVKVSVEYGITGSNATFNKEKDYDVLLSSSPVNISVSGDDQVNANQQANYVVNISSNSLTPVAGLILKVDYPFGFNLTGSDPKADSLDGSVFDLADLAPGATTSIKISGTIAGQNGEQRVLKFTVGTPDATDKTMVATPLALYTMTVSISKPLVGLTMLVNGDGDDQVPIDVGSKVSAEINWQNNLPDQVNNMSVKVSLTGAALDKTSVNVDNGFYNSSDNSITFDKTTNPELATVNPSDQGNMSFDFSTLLPSLAPNIQFANAEIGANIVVSGSQAGGNNAQEVLYSDQKILKISSNLNLLARGFRTVGPFENSGPFPPQVDSASTYTITWTATDSFNNVNNAQVTAMLSPNITWTGLTSPSTEDISYNQNTGAITWNIGNMQANTGITYPPREVSFQVSVTPSVTQLGSAINLIEVSSATGTDAYSGESVGDSEPAVTTEITSDPQYVKDIGKVVQ